MSILSSKPVLTLGTYRELVVHLEELYLSLIGVVIGQNTVILRIHTELKIITIFLKVFVKKTVRIRNCIL